MKTTIKTSYITMCYVLTMYNHGQTVHVMVSTYKLSHFFPSKLETLSVAAKLSNLLGGRLTVEGPVEITNSGVAISLAVPVTASVTVSGSEVLLVILLEIAWKAEKSVLLSSSEILLAHHTLMLSTCLLIVLPLDSITR